MEITKIELKILSKEFLTASNRVLRAGYEDYATELSKFIRFLDEHELIADYIKSCGEPECDVEDTVKSVGNSYGRSIFSLGTTSKNEVANIYGIVKYLADNDYDGRSYLYLGYSSSKKYQDKVDAFGDKFIRVLINHIESYLSKICIQMGVDDKTTINLKIENSTLSNTQLNLSSDGNTNNINNNNCDITQLQRLIDAMLSTITDMNDDDKQTIDDCVETIQTINDEKPKKGIIKMALNTLKGIAGTAEFAAAVASLVQFVGQYI